MELSGLNFRKNCRCATCGYNAPGRPESLSAVVRLEKQFLVVKVAAYSGARICSLVSKADGTEHVLWRGVRRE